MNIFIFLIMLCGTTIQAVTLDPTSIAGEKSDFMQGDPLPVPQPRIATLGSATNEPLLIDLTDDFPISEEPPPAPPRARASNPVSAPAYNYQRRAYSYEDALYVGGSIFLLFYGYCRLVLYVAKQGAQFIPSHNEQAFPKATAWIHQEMARHGFKKDDYALKTGNVLHEWMILDQAELPHLFMVPIQDAHEIELILTNYSDSALLDRYQCALHMISAQLSSRFISQRSADIKNSFAWAAASLASMAVSFVYLLEKEIRTTDSFDDLVHAALPSIAFYKTYKSMKRVNATETSYINNAIDTLPDELVPACIQFFEEKKQAYNGTSWYDGYIQRLKERLPQQRNNA